MDNNEPKKKFLHEDLKKPHYYGVKDGIHLFHGTHEDHKQHIGKHLENPSDEELKSGIEEAKTKGLHTLYVHGAPPQSLRSEIHPEIGAIIPGKLGKTEELIKMAKKIVADKKEESAPVSTQYWWKLNHAPSADLAGKYIKYDIHATDLKNIASTYDKNGHHVFSHADKKGLAKKHGSHTTALSRIDMPNYKGMVKANPKFAETSPKEIESETQKMKEEWRNRSDIKGNEPYKCSVPVSDHIKKNGVGEGKNILYYGCGRDYGGALALAGEGAKLVKEPLMNGGAHARDNEGNYLYQNQRIEGGKNKVTLHDPFHYDSSIIKNPTGKFDEIHSHYVMNVIDHETGKEVINNISKLLKPNGKAVISARRDNDMRPSADWDKLNSANKELAARKIPTPKAGMKTKLHKGEPKKYPAKKKTKQPPQASQGFTLSDLHDAVREHCKDFGHGTPSEEAFAPKKVQRLEPAPIKKSELLSAAKVALGKIEEEIVTLTTKDLAKGLISPEKNCKDCGCDVEGCMCFSGFPEPEFTFDGKQLTILFKSEWDEASKEAYIDDFKRRAGRLINK